VRLEAVTFRLNDALSLESHCKCILWIEKGAYKQLLLLTVQDGVSDYCASWGLC